MSDKLNDDIVEEDGGFNGTLNEMMYQKGSISDECLDNTTAASEGTDTMKSVFYSCEYFGTPSGLSAQHCDSIAESSVENVSSEDVVQSVWGQLMALKRSNLQTIRNLALECDIYKNERDRLLQQRAAHVADSNTASHSLLPMPKRSSLSDMSDQSAKDIAYTCDNVESTDAFTVQQHVNSVIQQVLDSATSVHDNKATYNHVALRLIGTNLYLDVENHESRTGGVFVLKEGNSLNNIGVFNIFSDEIYQTGFRPFRKSSQGAIESCLTVFLEYCGPNVQQAGRLAFCSPPFRRWLHGAMGERDKLLCCYAYNERGWGHHFYTSKKLLSKRIVSLYHPSCRRFVSAEGRQITWSDEPPHAWFQETTKFEMVPLALLATNCVLQIAASMENPSHIHNFPTFNLHEPTNKSALPNASTHKCSPYVTGDQPTFYNLSESDDEFVSPLN